MEATYSDSRAMSCYLLHHIVAQDGAKLLHIADSASFWTEHSDRATLPTLGGALPSIPTDWLDDLGRWSSKTSLGYVRAQLRRVAQVQCDVAAAVREGGLALGDAGEDELFAEWTLYLCKRGCASKDAVVQA